MPESDHELSARMNWYGEGKHGTTEQGVVAVRWGTLYYTAESATKDTFGNGSQKTADLFA